MKSNLINAEDTKEYKKATDRINKLLIKRSKEEKEALLYLLEYRARKEKFTKKDIKVNKILLELYNRL